MLARRAAKAFLLRVYFRFFLGGGLASAGSSIASSESLPSNPYRHDPGKLTELGGEVLSGSLLYQQGIVKGLMLWMLSWAGLVY